MKRTVIATLALAFGSTLFACGGGVSSVFHGGDDNGAQGDPDAPNGVPGGASSLGEIGPYGTASACVSDVASAELAPTNLVFMYDKSGSMGDAARGADPKLRWIPVGTGMKEFFADPYSKTLRASLQFFPLADDTIQTTCAYDYAKPSVALTNASEASFATAIDAQTPSGGTPTLPALEGAIAYAKQIAAERPNDKTAVVLVSDGEPGFYDDSVKAYTPGCTNNDIPHAAAAAKAALESSPRVPTYVIGVGPKLESLNAIASAGGTTSAVMVDVNDPAKTKLDITRALDAIRKSEVSCDFSIPPAPAGQTVDPFAVNVVLQNADGSEKVVGYSKACEAAEGWRYDDPAAPTRILLCSSACNEAKTSSLGKVSIAFGCKTSVAVR